MGLSGDPPSLLRSSGGQAEAGGWRLEVGGRRSGVRGSSLSSNSSPAGRTACSTCHSAVRRSKPKAFSAPISASVATSSRRRPQRRISWSSVSKRLPIGDWRLAIDGLPIDGLPIDGLLIDGLPIDGLLIDGLPIDGLPIDGLLIDGLLIGFAIDDCRPVTGSVQRCEQTLQNPSCVC